ncbi:MAG TPA: hypothetical protein V6C84_27575 [Coleofasciculaceae cyanobacterium]|jgi:GAF domain-containing protein
MSNLVNEWIDEQPACSNLLANVIQQVCEITGWEYGEIWLSKPDSPILQLSLVWHVSERLESDRQLSWQQFRYCSEKFTLKFAEGLPGRVWASQTPEWIADVSAESESYFLRNQIAKAFGVKAVFGLPINTQEIQAIAAFFKSEACDQDLQLMAKTEAIVAQFLQNSIG